jgi:hypothetical protein
MLNNSASLRFSPSMLSISAQCPILEKLSKPHAVLPLHLSVSPKLKALKTFKGFESFQFLVHRNAVLPKFMTWLNQVGTTYLV